MAAAPLGTVSPGMELGRARWAPSDSRVGLCQSGQEGAAPAPAQGPRAVTNAQALITDKNQMEKDRFLVLGPFV